MQSNNIGKYVEFDINEEGFKYGIIAGQHLDNIIINQLGELYKGKYNCYNKVRIRNIKHDIEDRTMILR